MQRNVYRIDKPGSLKRLTLQSEILPEPKDDEVSIEVKAIGLNFADIFAIHGLYSATPKESFIPGLEFSGKIVKKGNKIKGFRIGDDVFGVTRFGAYATHLNVSSASIFPLPKGWKYQDGAAFPVQALTAYYALVPLGQVKKGDHVLVHSAAGGVGIMAGHILQKKGAIGIGLVGDTKKIPIVSKIGYKHSIVRSKHFREELKEILKENRLDLVLECLGGSYFSDSYALLSPMGRLITYGSANFTPKGLFSDWIYLLYNYLSRPKLDPLSMISDNKAVMGFNLIWLWDQMFELRRHFSDLMRYKLPKQTIGATYSFDSMKDALQKFKSGATIGKVVVLIP